MIRDPSDGSVREAPNPVVGIPTAEMAQPAAPTGPDTGLRQPKKADAIERLDKSREWLKDYFAKKGATNGKA